MQILSHRGYWLEPGEKNSAGAFGRSFDLGFGTETDVRDFNGELVISHDIPTGAELRFEDFLDILDGRDLPLALNIKADGLGDLVARKMHQRGLSQWFTFDMSVPELVRQLDAGLPAFTRRSEYERSDLLYDSATGVWLDAFSSVWFDAPYIHSLLGDGKRVCVVSPELHGRPPEPFWDMLIDGGLLLTDMMVCTDVPETLQSLVRSSPR